MVYYDRQDRAAGDGKLSFLSRIKYAMDAITSFSYKPMRLSFALFIFTSCVATLLTFSMFVSRSVVATAALGVVAAQFFVGGLLLLCMGVLGEYLGRVYDEVRNRPLSIVSKVHTSTAGLTGMMAVQTANFRNSDEDTEAA
jgi:dolichol-phosphate mannosyltransferase